MRRGSNPTIMFDRKGNIFAIATGSDACAEHETGSMEMQRSHASGYRELDEYVRQLKKASITPSIENTPSILDMKSIDKHDDMVFVEGVANGEPFATFYSFSERNDFYNNELEKYSSNRECTGAWDNRHFAFRVYGEKLIKKLRHFYDGIKENDAFFAGYLMGAPCFDKPRPSGVIIARKSMLRPEHHEYLRDAKQKYFDEVLLGYHSKKEDIDEAFQKKGVFPGYIWPVWKNRDKLEIAYRINPSYEFQNRIPYGSDFTYDELIDFVNQNSKKKNKLK